MINHCGVIDGESAWRAVEGERENQSRGASVFASALIHFAVLSKIRAETLRFSASHLIVRDAPRCAFDRFDEFWSGAEASAHCR